MRMKRNALGIVALVTAGMPALALAQPVQVAQVWAVDRVSQPGKQVPSRFSMFAQEAGEAGYTFTTGRRNTLTGTTPCFAVWKANNTNGSIDPAQGGWETLLSDVASECYGVCITVASTNQHVYAAGVAEGSNGKDIIIAGFNISTGALLWPAVRYNNAVDGANGDDVPVVIKVRTIPQVNGTDATPIVYVGGDSIGNTPTGASSGYDMVVLKLDGLTGQSLWGYQSGSNPRAFRYNWVNGDDQLSDMVIPADGPPGPDSIPDPRRILITGPSKGAGTGLDFLTVSVSNSDPFDPLENLPFIRTALAGNEVATSLTVIYSSLPEQAPTAAFVTGYSNNTASLTNDMLTKRYNGSLTGEVWSSTYNGAGNKNDYAREVVYVQATAVGIWVGGDSWQSDSTGFDVTMIRYDPVNGNPAWPNTPPFHLGAALYDHPTAHKEDRLLDMIVDSKGNAYAVGKSFNGTTFDVLAISWFQGGLRRWIRTDVPPPQPDHVLFNGSGNGEDLGGCIHLNSAQEFQLDADVLIFGTGLVNTGGANVVRYILNKYDQTLPP